MSNRCRKWGIFTSDVSIDDAKKVSNFKKIKKFRTKEKAEKYADREKGDRVYCVD